MCYKEYGYPGGAGNTSTANFYTHKTAAGGGGGATHSGYPADGTQGGNGGAGLMCDITGENLDYGSGGGGASIAYTGGYAGGNGAGDARTEERPINIGEDALPNRGGGGGGGCRSGGGTGAKEGGNGGSGIVVFRYEQLVDFSELSSRLAAREYNGNVQTIEDSVAYTVTGENKSATEYGTYSVIITPKDGYLWPDTKTNEGREYTWSITQATNEWTQDCAVTISTWTISLDEPGAVTPALAKYGNVVAKIKKEGEENEVDFDNESFPEEAGTYTVTYYPETTASFNSAGMPTQSFTVVILSPEEIPDYTVTIGEVTASLDRKVTIPYNVACTATTGYKTTLYVEYVTEGVETKTNTYDAIALNKPGSTGDLVVEDLKPGATYTVKVFAQVNDHGQVGEIVELEPVYIAIPGAATGLTANATFTDESFTISGKINPAYTPGADDYTIVTVYWSLNGNGNTFDNSQEFKFKDTDDGVFNVTQAYNAITDKLYWKVEVSNTITTDTWAGQTFDSSNSEGLNITQQVKERKDSTSITYTWTGNGGDNLWTNRVNWSWVATDPNATVVEAYGYPGTISSGGSYGSRVVFDSNAIVDLNGATMYVNGAFEMASGIEVEVRNGTLGFQTLILSLGAEKSTLTLKNVLLPYNSSKPSTRYTIKPADNSTLIIDGDNSLAYAAYGHLKYSPTTSGRFMLKNYAGRMFTTNEAFDDNSKVVISNTQWSVWVGETSTSTAPNGLAKKLVFHEGDQQSGKIRFLAYYWGDESYAPVNLDGTECDIKLTETSHLSNTEKILAKNLTKNATVYFNIDATDYKEATPVKLLYLTKIEKQFELTPVLNMTENGVPIPNERQAEIYYEAYGDGRVYYYKQSSQNVAAIATVAVDNEGEEFTSYVEYPTLNKALDAANDGAEIKILKDIATDAAFEITKKVTIDLNGKRVKANDTAATTDGNGVFWVKNGGELTLEDSSEEKTGTVDGNGGNAYKMAVWADGGKVVINGGNYVNENDGPDNQYDLIYVKNGGEVVINGGTFKCQTPRWTLNSNNTNTGRFVVTGGKFYQYNPTDFDTDEAVTTWCTEDYVATKGDDDYFTVVNKPTIQLTIELGDGVSSVDYTIAGNTTTTTEDTTIDIAESGTVVSFTAVAGDGYFAPTVEAVTVTETTTVTIAGVAFSAVESADEAITDANRNAVYAWAKNKGKSQSEVSAANYLYADYLFNFTEFSTAEPTIEITEFTADPLVIKAKVTVGGVMKIEDLSVDGLELNGTLKYKAAATLEALETATPKTTLEETDRFFKIVVE